MKLKLIIAFNANHLEELIQQWLDEIVKEVDADNKSQWTISRKVVDPIEIHHIFQTMQVVQGPGAGSVIKMGQQDLPTYQICLFIFYTMK